MQGKIKRDKGGLLLGLMPLAWKQAQALEGQQRPNQVTNVLNVQQNTLTVQMSDKQLDDYLDSNEGMQIEVVKREPEQITLQASSADETKIKIPHTAIQTILHGSDTKITKEQSLRLFGEVLADTKKLGVVATPEPNLADYDHVFEPQKSKLPEGVYHVLEGFLIEHPTLPELTVKRWKCINCGAISTKGLVKDRELCPGKPLEISSNLETGSEQ